jgi:hypothetical protein
MVAFHRIPHFHTLKELCCLKNLIFLHLLKTTRTSILHYLLGLFAQNIV